MTQTLKASFDGKVFTPKEPVKIPAQSDLEIVVRTPRKKAAATPAPYSALKLAASLKLKGPANFSENLDEYLYRGKPLK